VIQGLSVGLVIPALWQQEAIRALQGGKDVVVQAPTGSGKTYIFELLYPNLKTQAVFTVPTRAVTMGSSTEPSSSTASRKAPSRASPTRVHALHPNLPRSPIMHHKPLMMRAIGFISASSRKPIDQQPILLRSGQALCSADCRHHVEVADDTVDVAHF